MSINTLPAILGGKVAPDVPTFHVTGYQMPAATGDNFGAPEDTWTNLSNVLTENDTPATISTAAGGVSVISVKDFNFSIPAGAIVYGLDVQVRWSSSRTDSKNFGHFMYITGGGGANNRSKDFAGYQMGPDASNTMRTDSLSSAELFIGPCVVKSDFVADMNDGSGIEVAVTFTQPPSTGTSTISVAWIKAQLRYMMPKAGNQFAAMVTLSGGTGANVDGAGTVAWSNPGNALVDDAAFATSDVSKEGRTEILRVTNFGAAVPSDAKIAAIIAEVDFTNITAFTDMEQLDIWTGSTAISMDLPQNTTAGAEGGNFVEPWRNSTASSPLRYSGLCDIGTVDQTKLGGITPATLNGSGFGLQIVFLSRSSVTNPPVYNIDRIRMKVIYTEST